MQPIQFPGSVEIKKPKNMTDEECMSIWAVIHEEGIDGSIVGYTQAWKPSYEDLQALNRGEPIYIFINSKRLPPIAVYTNDEKGISNDVG